jgi:hypothetical protein
MAKKEICCVTFVLIAISLLNVQPTFSRTAYPVDRPVVSVTENPLQNENQDLGNFAFDHEGSIRGEIHRNIPFEVVPSEEFMFDLNLQNIEEIENRAEILLRLDIPNGSRRSYFNEEITLDGYEKASFLFSGFVPEGLVIYGRYTLKLFIDNRLEDFFQFDLHSRGSIEVRWDDGVINNGWAFEYLCNAWAIRGCLPEGSVLDSAGVYILSEGDPYWPWPDGIHQDILMQIFDNDGPGGFPGTLVFSDVTRVKPGTSHAVVYPRIAISSAFYIANDQLTDYPDCEAQGVDAEVNHPDQMFIRMDNVWENAGHAYGGDFMIWGVAHVGSELFVIGNPPGLD